MNETIKQELNKIKQNSLAELLDFIEISQPPLSRDDLTRFVTNFGIDLNFYGDNQERAVLYYDTKEYFFNLEKDKLYYWRKK